MANTRAQLKQFHIKNDSSFKLYKDFHALQATKAESHLL